MNYVIYLILASVIAFSSIALGPKSDHAKSGVNAFGPHGPAPNSHDGYPDGSGNDAPFGPINGG